MKFKEKIIFSIFLLIFLSHLLLPIIQSSGTHQINYFMTIFAFLWGSATFLIFYIALKYLGLKNFSLDGVINSKVNLNQTDMVLVKIAILLYIGGISFVLIGIYFFNIL